MANCKKEGCNGRIIAECHTHMTVAGLDLRVIIPEGSCEKCFTKQLEDDFHFCDKEVHLFLRANDQPKEIIISRSTPMLDWECFAAWQKKAIETWIEGNGETIAPHPTYRVFRLLRHLGLVSTSAQNNCLVMNKEGTKIENPAFDEVGNLVPSQMGNARYFFFTNIWHAQDYARCILNQKNPIQAFKLIP